MFQYKLHLRLSQTVNLKLILSIVLVVEAFDIRKFQFFSVRVNVRLEVKSVDWYFMDGFTAELYWFESFNVGTKAPAIYFIS